jgi:hypothetical protein
MGIHLVGSEVPMPVLSKLPGYRWFRFLKNPSLRTGIYSGLFLSLIFSGWILIANRAPFLEPFAMERNVAATVLMAFFASLPVMRFYRSPEELLVSGLLSWSLLTLTYQIFGLLFVLLEQYYGVLQVFVLGAVSYLIFATLSWIGRIIWRVRASTHGSQIRH